MSKSKRKSKPRNVVQAVLKKSVKSYKHKVTKVKPMYTCISKNHHPKEFVRERINQHGAKDDIREVVEAVELVFSYQNHMNRREDTPRILHAHYSFCTTDLELAAKYHIGQEYTELPK